jgi:multiple sugar transport system permease protein
MATTDQIHTTLAASTASTAIKRSRMGLESQQRFWGWVFLSPWIIGFVIFTLAPMIFSLYFAFTDFNLASPEPMKYIGAANWQKLFTEKENLQAIGVTLKFMLIAVPIGMALPIGLATLLNSKVLRGRRIWTTLFYMPYIVPAVSTVFIWLSFLNGESGWLNRILRMVGVADPPNYIFDANWILFAFILVGVWGVGNAMLVTLATMQGVPTELYEAADVDGAGGLTKFRRITLPMISPVIFYNLVLSVIGLMQYFVVPYIMTNGTGDPDRAAYFYNMHLYKTAFKFADMGYAAAQAWLLFIIALILTVVLFATSRRWVYYSSGD